MDPKGSVFWKCRAFAFWVSCPRPICQGRIFYVRNSGRGFVTCYLMQETPPHLGGDFIASNM